MIRASCGIKASIYRADFDAASYFDRATDAEISLLLAHDFCEAYLIWDIASYLAACGSCRELKSLFEHLDLIRPRMLSAEIEGVINKEDAIIWLQTHRPYLLKA